MSGRSWRGILSAIGMILLPAIWFGLSYVVGVPERYLPTPGSVLNAWRDIDPPLPIHILATASRIATGTVAGTIAGIVLALLIARWTGLRRLLMPSVLALRAVPPIATVPFFLLWFGFSEVGKFLLVAIGIGLNIVVAALQILDDTDERFRIALRSLATSAEEHSFRIALPLVLQDLLPTLRTSIALIFGAALVSELLGSQIGLGYLIQTSRQTFSMHVVFLATLLLGLLATLLDWMVVKFWQVIIYWRRAQTSTEHPRLS